MQVFCYLSAASLAHKNPQGSKISHMLPRRTQRSIDQPQDDVFVEYTVRVIYVAVLEAFA